MLDHTSRWADLEWTEQRTAILPVRMQPPHRGHLNLLLNLRNRFRGVAVIVYERPIDEDNPFTATDRIKWIKKSLEWSGEDDSKIKLSPSPGISSWVPQERMSNLLSLSSGTPFVIVSFNPDTISGCIRLSLPFMQPLNLDRLLELHPDLLNNMNDNSRKIRAALKIAEPLPEGYLLPGVSEEEIRSHIQ